MLRRILYLLSTIGILFPADLGVHVLQTPVMWAHYQEALAENSALSFMDFLEIHTNEEAHDLSGQKEHEEDMPCHHHHAMQSSIPIFHFQEPSVSSPFLLEPENEIQFGEPSLLLIASTNVSVWNPPRFS